MRRFGIRWSNLVSLPCYSAQRPLSLDIPYMAVERSKNRKICDARQILRGVKQDHSLGRVLALSPSRHFVSPFCSQYLVFQEMCRDRFQTMATSQNSFNLTPLPNAYRSPSHQVSLLAYVDTEQCPANSVSDRQEVSLLVALTVQPAQPTDQEHYLRHSTPCSFAPSLLRGFHTSELLRRDRE